MTLEAGAIERARQAAGPRSLSSFLDAPLQEKLERHDRRESLFALLQELDDVDPITAEARGSATKRAAQLRAAVEG